MVTSDNCANRPDDWFIDSAATSHMTFNRDILLDYEEFEEPKEVSLGDDYSISSIGAGKARLPFIDENGSQKNLKLERVLYVPDIAKNLLSVPCMTSFGYV